MSFLIYFAMVLAALVSVVMGLDVVSAPPVRTAATPALVEPIRHEATPAVPSPAPVAQQPAPPRQAASPPPQPMPRTEQKPEPAPACNVQACEAAYQSFTATDCTYQPFDGPRRLCTK